MKRVSAWLAALLLAVMVPVSAFAAEGDGAAVPPSAGGQTEVPAENGEGDTPGQGEGSVTPPGEGEPDSTPGGVNPDDIPDGTGNPEEGQPGDDAPGTEEGDGTPKERPQLETERHIVYIEGDEDDVVRPEDPLTRAEAAKIIYSLLRNPPENAVSSGFADVPQNAWYMSRVDSLAATGLISGYPDGSFRPENRISRAEYVTVLTHCFEPRQAEMSFSDVAGHWAYEQLSTAVAYGWLHGYEDGTVRPDADITRAEAIAIANRALGRSGDTAALRAKGMPLRFTDLSTGSWAYADIMEASLPHEYETGEKGESWTSCTVPRARRAPGYHSVGGELYCVSEDGYYVHNETVGVLQFDAGGRYVTGNSRLDALLTDIVRRNTVPGASPHDNLRRLYNYVMNNYTYRANTFVKDGATGWEAQRAYTMLQNRKGNCYDYAALFTMLARKLGYQAQGRSGWIRTASWSWDEHGWTQISLGGQTFLCDPEFQGVYVRKHGLSWDLFMKQYGSTPTQYRVAGRVLK